MKKTAAFTLALTLAFSLCTARAADFEDFTDKDAIQYQEAVSVLNRLGIITGYADQTFRPLDGLSRGAAAKIIVSLLLGSDAVLSQKAPIPTFRTPIRFPQSSAAAKPPASSAGMTTAPSGRAAASPAMPLQKCSWARWAMTASRKALPGKAGRRTSPALERTPGFSGTWTLRETPPSTVRPPASWL